MPSLRTCHELDVPAENFAGWNSALAQSRLSDVLVEIVILKPLFHRDAGAFRAIQKTLQMEVCEQIVRLPADMRGKSSHCSSVARFQFGKGIEIRFVAGDSYCSLVSGSNARNASVLPRRTRSPTGRPESGPPWRRAERSHKCGYRVLFAPQDAATLIVSP